jgi:hypothetical protein
MRLAHAREAADGRLARLCVLGLLVICISVGGRSFAQQTAPNDGRTKTVRIVRTDRDQAPVIDGRLDDDVWARAAVIDDFHQVTPVEYAQPTERTRVLLLYDNDTLYIGVRLYDDEPQNINARVLRQGEGLGSDDRFFVMLDTFNNRRSGYLFGMNPNGVRFDGLFQNVTERQFNWDGIWDGASTIRDGASNTRFRSRPCRSIPAATRGG